MTPTPTPVPVDVEQLTRDGDLFLAGEFRAARSDDELEVFDPATGARLTSLRAAAREDVDAAVHAARTAFPDWAVLAPAGRADWLNRLADAVRAGADELAVVETLDTGHPYRAVRDEDLPEAVEFLRYYAALCGERRDDLYQDPASGGLTYTAREPVGVVAAIVPWNYPLSQLLQKVAPALAAGNTVVAKPAEQTPLSTLHLARLMRDAGLPPGVFNVVNGRGEDVGAALAGHPGVDLVTFTGSSQTGRLIMAAAAPNLTRVILELGGKTPFVVFDDADLDAAVETCVFSSTVNAGQLCTAATRLIVQRSLHDELVERVAERAARLRVGLPFDPATQIGAIVSLEQLDRVAGFVERARAAGFQPVVGGGPLTLADAPNGWYYAPTILPDVDPKAEIARAEVFGPVLTTFPFDDEADAVRLANDTDYGLAAGVWTSDLARAHRISARLHAGVVWVNTSNSLGMDVPHEGFGASGFGFEGGYEGMAAMTRSKAVSVAVGGDAPRHEPMVPSDVGELTARIRRHQDRLLADLESLVRIRSVSADPGCAAEMEHSATAVAALFAAEGFDTRIVSGAGGQPGVLAHRPGPDGVLRVLLYAHHDVQPARPDEWTTAPFEPVRRDGRLYGRGASDDKAGICVHLGACRVLPPDLPLDLTVFVEGEEETDSIGLADILAEHAELLDAEVVVVADSASWRLGVPTLTRSLRGEVRFDLEVRTLDHGLHSGAWGGLLPDALMALARVLASFHDHAGDVAIAGLARAPGPPLDADEERLADAAGRPGGGRWIGRGTVVERLWSRPSLTIVGLDAPPVAQASNTLTPSARARVSMRLAPGEDVARAVASLRRHVAEHVPWGAQHEIVILDQAEPAVLDTASPAYRTARQAFTDAWGGVALAEVGVGGSIPFVAAYQSAHPDATILVSATQDPDTRAHGADESLHLAEFERMVLAEATLLRRLATDDDHLDSIPGDQ